ncbi:hypothetical protein AYJ66_01780 [Dietzia cinnamea]|nr:hypothetical protein AYJ66_01780 [Dietzia cinnamea]
MMSVMIFALATPTALDMARAVVAASAAALVVFFINGDPLEFTEQLCHLTHENPLNVNFCQSKLLQVSQVIVYERHCA